MMFGLFSLNFKASDINPSRITYSDLSFSISSYFLNFKR